MNAITKLAGAVLLCLMAGCAGGPKPGADVDGLIVIDVENAMDNLQEELTLSDVADSVWYLPLETTDDGLVGNQPAAYWMKGRVVVTANSGKDCLAFDGQTGRFLNSIGHVGEDPEGHSGITPELDAGSGWLYFIRHPNSLQKYDVEGHYLGKLTLSGMELSNCDLELADSLLVCHIYHIPPFAGENKLLLFNARGQAVDSVIFPWAEPPVVGKQLVTIYLQGDSWDRLILEYTDRSHWVWALDGMDVQDGRMTYRPAFSDTLYALSGNKLQPWVALHTGKYRFPDVEGRTVTSGYSDKLVANRIQVTPENIYFTCELDTYDEQELFEGIYDRRTGRTRLSPASHEGYTDDLTGFMPVPRRYPHGVQVSLIEAYKVVEWLDEHPEARSNSALAGLAQVKEEDNPVAVFVRYK